jgi:hypothetical protein
VGLAVGSKCKRNMWSAQSFMDMGIDDGGKDGVMFEKFVFKRRRSVRKQNQERE